MADQPSLADLLVEHGDALVGHFNGDHPDCVELLARAHGRLDSVHDAQLVEVRTTGVVVSYASAPASAPTVAEVSFRQPLVSLDSLTERALEMLADSRGVLGITTLSSFEQELAEVSVIPTRLAEVVRTERISPNFVQITVGGGDLDGLPADAYDGFDVFAYVLVPPPGHTELTIDNTFTWEAYSALPEDERPVGAYYTVRNFRAAADGAGAELDLIFAIHDLPEGVEGGHAVRFGASAAPGDPVALWGPRQGEQPSADTDWLLLVADETGMPQVSVLLERLPAELPIHVVIELDDMADTSWIPARDNATISWCLRQGEEAGTTSLLVDTVRSLELPDGKGFAWGGAESRAMTAVRKHLRNERGMEREQVTMVGYWRHALSPVELVD